MTGYANVSRELPQVSFVLELKAVNNRYLDIQFRIPDDLRYLEAGFRERIAAKLARGKVECRLSVQARAVADSQALNTALLQQLQQHSGKLQGYFPQARELSVAELLNWPGMLVQPAADMAQQTQQLLALMDSVLDEFNASRQREGDKLKQFLLQRVARMQQLREQVMPRLPAAIEAYRQRLLAKLSDVLQQIDDERLSQEISVYAAKIDVDEELSRLDGHLTEVLRVLDKGGPVGKRLDFLMQELNREANTLGSKSVDAEVSRAAVDMKVAIEQMREQVQNLE